MNRQIKRREVLELQTIRIKNYKTLKDVEITNLSNLVAFIGKNLSGKSNLFDCLVFLCEGTRNDLQTAIENREGWREIVWRKRDNEILIELEFSLKDETRVDLLRILFSVIDKEKKYKDLFESHFLTEIIYTLRFKILDDKNSFFEDLKIKNFDKKQSLLIAQNILHSKDNKIIHKVSNLAGIKNELLNDRELHLKLSEHGKSPWNNGKIKLLFYDQSTKESPTFEVNLINKLRDKIKNIKWLEPFKKIESRKEISGSDILSYDASNLTDVIHSLSSNNPEKFDELKKEIKQIIHGISNILSPIEEKLSTIGLQEIYQSTSQFYKLNSLSSGTKNVLAILTLLILTEENSLILLEEPEVNLHPSAIRDLMEVIMSCSLNTQIFFSTHSSCTILNFKIENINLVTRDNNNNTKIKNLTFEGIDYIIEELGITPSDFFNYNVLLFVEGEYDVIILNEFINKKPDSFNNIGLIPLDGWTKIKYQANAKILKKLQVKPKLFAILDGDIESRPKEKEHLDNLKEELEIPEDNIFTLKKGELEAYLLNIDAWYTTWPDLKDKIERDKLKEKFEEILESEQQKEILSELIDSLDLGEYNKETAKKIAQNIKNVPEEIKEIFSKVRNI
jgi:predicted ATPase